MAWRFCCLSCSHNFSYQASTEIHCPQCGSDHIETNPFSLDSGRTLGEAERYYEEAEALSRSSGDKLGLADALNNMGISYRTQGDLDKALELFLQALPIFEETGYRRGQADNLNSVGITYGLRNEPQKAREHFQKALQLFQEMGSTDGAGAVLSNLGRLQLELEDS